MTDLRMHDLSYLGDNDISKYQVATVANDLTGEIQPIFQGPDGFQMTIGKSGYVPYYPPSDPRSQEKITSFVNPDNLFIHVDNPGDFPSEYSVKGDLARKVREELRARQAIEQKMQKTPAPKSFFENILDRFNALR